MISFCYNKKLAVLLVVYCLSIVYRNTLVSVVSGIVRDEVVMVETNEGRVLGRREGSVNSYLGIPFAEPPIGHLRFRPPKRKTAWYPAILRAFNFTSECLQSTLFAAEDPDGRPRDEDCLHLNIWQPSRPRKDGLYPVLVFIYGGAFLHGGTTRPEYAGNKLAERGVIVVSFNYRLGALGFLVSVADGLFGNYGLDDQKLAIQWVQDNIRAFGGDPNRVTLFGESAGAMSIGLHVLDQQYRMDQWKRKYPMQSFRKLFQAVIMQSNPMGYKYRSLAVANFIGADYKAQLDCEDLKCLQSESPEELMVVQDSLMAVPRSIGDFFTWGPVITDSSYAQKARLYAGPLSNITVRQPIEALKILKRVDVSVIIGTNSHEGTVFVFTAYPSRMPKFIFQTLVFSFFRTNAPNVLNLYKGFSKQISESPYPDYRLVLAKIIGDYLFRCPNQYFAEQLQTESSKFPVFLYEFSLPTRTPGFPCCDGLACHTCELPYVFNQLSLIELDYTWVEDTESHNNYKGRGPAGGMSRDKSSVIDIFGAVSSTSNNLMNNPNDEFSLSSSSSIIMASKPHKPTNSDGNNENADTSVFESSTGDKFILFDSIDEDSDDEDDEENDGNQSLTFNAKRRLLIDKEVSRSIAEYWVTFATYFDPNGLASLNGYEGNTRPYGNPYWPKLLGGFNFQKNSAKEQFDSIELPVTSDESDDKIVEISSTLNDYISQSENNQRNYNDYDFDRNYNIDDNMEDESLFFDDTQSFPLNNPFQRKNKLQRFSKKDFNRKRLHQIVFDQKTEVEIIEYDCICNGWNRLGYRF
eukprot:gene8016-10864_t